jgi:acyl transferase domain-containing protein
LLNNFGVAGSNAALLEECPTVARLTSLPGKAFFVFGLSAKTESSLGILRSRYLAWLQSPESADIELCDISYTATAWRQMYPYRMAVTARNKRELVGKLAKASAVHVTTTPGRVVFVFPGQGSQYIGMGESLYCICPDFKRDIDGCHSFLISFGFPGFSRSSLLTLWAPNSPNCIRLKPIKLLSLLWYTHL